MTVPRGFEGYARIFFPLLKQGHDSEGNFVGQYAPWTEVATRNGRTVHALMERETISISQVGETNSDDPCFHLARTNFRNCGGYWLAILRLPLAGFYYGMDSPTSIDERSMTAFQW